MAEDLKTAAGDAAARARDRVGSFVDEVRDMAAPLLDTARERLAEGAQAVRDRVSEGAGQMKEKNLNEVGEDISRYVRRNPGKVMVGAFAVGLIVGALVRGRDRS